ncbi:MAG: hypothetical protein KatS3mg113_0850 [Planctomycetaceae bacterium]|nr:MAG: hypothetical protein KatS3mg113_0850 [Planctomycetaceae bacterium]
MGGDLYTYALPQKHLYKTCLAEGRWPLWNHLTGFGYPQHAESQTGAGYPLHLLLYGLLPNIHTAWNITFIIHYISCYVGTYTYARIIGLSRQAAHLCALVFVFSWFPARSCLEWAISTGSYLPWHMALLAAYRLRGQTWMLNLLSVTLALQILLGHYQVAFYSILLLIIYALLPIQTLSYSSTLSEVSLLERRHTGKVIWVIVLGLGLAACQWIPTWELSQRSQRQLTLKVHDPNEGYIPWPYLSQLFAPWWWYAPERHLDALLSQLPGNFHHSQTNRVEAHLYFGQLPLYLVLITQGYYCIRRRLSLLCVSLVIISIVSVLVATGSLQSLLIHIPVFSSFRGVGRISLITAWCWALLTGVSWDSIRQFFRLRSVIPFTLVWLFTTFDLWWWHTPISYTQQILHPPYDYLHQSALRQVLKQEADLLKKPIRLFAPGANVVNLLNVSTYPIYLGLAPAEYYHAQYIFPDGESLTHTGELGVHQLRWLYEAGITHILTMQSLRGNQPAAELIWADRDPFLNRVWARWEPLYLYRLTTAPGRCYWAPKSSQASQEPWPATSTSETLDYSTAGIEVRHYAPHAVQMRVVTDVERDLILADLVDPGWIAHLDGQTVPVKKTGPFRRINVPAGEHVLIWT